MAFFKLRFPGQAAAEAAASGSSESVESVRRRARHRLIGAVVLVLVAVVGLPLLFDTQPRPVAVDTPILIPDRNSAPPLRDNTPAPAAPSAPIKVEKPDAVVPKPKNDSGKAQALAEAKSDKITTERLVIQVGVYSDAAKVREVRRKLDMAGIKNYTQVVEKDDKPSTRIRVGPFANREEAEKLLARIRKLDMPATVLKI
jgi:DedD protein